MKPHVAPQPTLFPMPRTASHPVGGLPPHINLVFRLAGIAPRPPGSETPADELVPDIDIRTPLHVAARRALSALVPKTYDEESPLPAHGQLWALRTASGATLHADKCAKDYGLDGGTLLRLEPRSLDTPATDPTGWVSW